MNERFKYGINVGILASIYLGLMAILGDHGGSPLKYGKYLILIAGLYMYYSRRTKRWTYNQFVARFIGSASVISIITAIIIIITNTVLYFINPEFSIEKYTMSATDISQLLSVNIVILVETVVLGLLTAFIIFPIFKNKFLDDKGIQQPEEFPV